MAWAFIGLMTLLATIALIVVIQICAIRRRISKIGPESSEEKAGGFLPRETLQNTNTGTRNPELNQEMRAVVTEVEDLLTTVGNEGGARAREVQDRVIAALDAAKQRLSTLEAQMRATARKAPEKAFPDEGMTALDSLFQAQPGGAVTAAAIVKKSVARMDGPYSQHISTYGSTAISIATREKVLVLVEGS